MVVLCISILTLNRHVEVLMRRIIIFEVLIDVGEVEVIVCIAFIQLNGDHVLLHRLLELLEVVEREAEVLVVEGEVLLAASLIDLALL